MVTTVRKKSFILFVICTLLFSMIWIFTANKYRHAEAAVTSFRFVVMGDSRGSTKGVNETTLRSLMKKVKGLSVQPSFILFTGDQVTGGADVANQLSSWKNVMDDYYPITWIYPALGNHENDETIFSKAFTQLPSGQLSGYQRSAYYYDYGNTRFITLNSNRKDSNGQYIIDSKQRAWLQNVLASNGKTHNFVQFHVPAYPIGAHYGSSLDANAPQRDALWDIMDNNYVTAVLVGHEHNYNRRKIDSSFNGSGLTFQRSIYQLTIGGGGAPLSSTKKDSRNVIVGPVASYQYTVVDIADEKATFTVYDINNNLIDSFSVIRPIPKPTTTISFQNGVYPSNQYAGTRDTFLSQNNSAANYGSSSKLLVDGDDPVGSSKDLEAMIKWDISSIPLGKEITSATVSFNISETSTSTYELYQMKRNWSESGSTWNKYNSISNWAVAGAKGWGDKGDTILGTISASSLGNNNIVLNSSGRALVQAWINNPSTNYGLILMDSSNTNGMDILSSEYSLTSKRPKLSVTYR